MAMLIQYKVRAANHDAWRADTVTLDNDSEYYSTPRPPNPAEAARVWNEQRLDRGEPLVEHVVVTVVTEFHFDVEVQSVRQWIVLDHEED